MNNSIEYRYKALKNAQTRSGKEIVLFNAPAHEIAAWAGVPQKKRFDEGGETLGFQRDENANRITDLGNFCSNPENVIQNPLLCALRDLSLTTVEFQPIPNESEPSQFGTLLITVPDYRQLTLLEVLANVREYIEARVPELATKALPDHLINSLKERAGFITNVHEETDRNGDTNGSDESDDNGNDPAAVLLLEESHIVDFWEEIAVRHQLLLDLGAKFTGDELCGYSRDALMSFIKPVVVVDGQHRLQGALRALESQMDSDSIQHEIVRMIEGGVDSESVDRTIREREARQLPLSLLLSSDPAEQVFQFVVVNQKATPIGKALLGTIVSTTLSNSEIEPVTTRLTKAGIKLEESKAITYLIRSELSPFCDLVERGLAGAETGDVLKWSVLASLVNIFRRLKGGRLFHSQVDYADGWGNKYLSESGIIPDDIRDDRDKRLEYWGRIDGPWRDVMVSFFSAVRDKLGNRHTADAHNYWGRPRHSNLFNKISLTILAADFFRYLRGARRGIDAVADVPRLVDEWLEDVNCDYFDRDWKLSGVKKDSTGIRSQWSQLWAEYRDNPTRLPQVRNYRTPRS